MGAPVMGAPVMGAPVMGAPEAAPKADRQVADKGSHNPRSRVKPIGALSGHGK